MQMPNQKPFSQSSGFGLTWGKGFFLRQYFRCSEKGHVDFDSWDRLRNSPGVQPLSFLKDWMK